MARAFGRRSGAVHDHSDDARGGSSVGPGEVTLADSSADPSSNGEIRRNGSDAKVFSGGAVKNLTEVGGGISAIEAGDVSDLNVTTVNQSIAASGLASVASYTSPGKSIKSAIIGPSNTEGRVGFDQIVVTFDDSTTWTIGTDGTEVGYFALPQLSNVTDITVHNANASNGVTAHGTIITD